MKSIGDGVTLAMASVGICCGASLLLGAVGAGTLGLGPTTTGFVVVGVGSAVVSVILLAVRHARHGRAHVR